MRPCDAFRITQGEDTVCPCDAFRTTQGEDTAHHLHAFSLSCAVFAVDGTAQDERTADELNERQAFAQEEHGEYDCRNGLDISADGYRADGELLHRGEIKITGKACIDDAEHQDREIVIG